MRFFGFVFFFFLMNFSCGSKKNSSTNSFNQAKILVNQVGEPLKYKIVKYKTLKYQGHLEGDYGSYFSGTSFEYKDDLVYIQEGVKVKLNIKVEDGVMIPMSYHSHLLLSHYYSMERLMEFWQENGLDFTDLKYNFYYESSVFKSSYFFPRFLIKNLNYIKRKNNAAFSVFGSHKGFRSFFIEKEGYDLKLPVALNYTIIAHEFGHNIFDKAFTARDPKIYKANSKEASYILSGMNEGCADFFASVATASSLKGPSDSLVAMEKRVLPVNFTSSHLTKRESYYRWGSVLASCLNEIAMKVGRIEVALQLYKALEFLREDWENVERGDFFDYHYLAKRMIEMGAKNNLRTFYGEIFQKWFDDSLNSSHISSYY